MAFKYVTQFSLRRSTQQPSTSTMTKVAPCEDKHVAVLAFPFGTHAGPLLSLIRAIAAEAPHVTFSFFSTSQSNKSLFSKLKEEEIQNIKYFNVHDGLPQGFVPTGNPLVPISFFIKAMPETYRQAMDEAVAATNKKITCLVTDAFLWFSAAIAEEMRANWVPLWTAGPHSILAHLLTDLIRENVDVNHAIDDQMVDCLPGFSALKASDMPDGVVDGIESPFTSMVHNMGLMLPRATAVAINSFAGAHPISEKGLESSLKLFLNVGPFTLTTPQTSTPDEQGCLEFLDKCEKVSVVYISCGSSVIPPPHELSAIAESLEEGEFPFIWAFRGNPEKQLPHGFLDRTRTKGKVVAWAPQMEILKHPSVGVCLTHCGWNSILDCVVGGVPMISRPFFGDQKLNTRLLENVWEIGVGVEGEVFSKKGTLKALKEIMSSKKGEKMRQNMRHLRETAMKAAGPDGNSRKDFITLIKIVTS